MEARSNTSSHRLSGNLFQAETRLTLTAVRSEQFSEKIFCRAENFVQKKSTSVTLYVHYKPEVELSQLNEDGSGGLVQFRCRVRARPRGRADWYLNGKPLSQDLISGDTLSLRPSPGMDGATVACNATNNLGTDRKEIRVRLGGNSNQRDGW